MPRPLVAALAALALALQATAAIAAFAQAPAGCCCARRAKNHHCACPECARHRHLEDGCASLGGCAPDSTTVLPAPASRPFLPSALALLPPLPRAVAPADGGPAPPGLIAPEVPTPPPLG